MSKEPIPLGSKCRDTVSGWEGIAVARYEYMNGCVRYELAAKNEKGEPTGFVFDEPQIEVLELITRSSARRAIRRAVGGPRDSAPVPR